MYNPSLAGGSLYDMGIYPLAMAWFFLEEEPINKTVVGRNASTGVDNDVSIMFEFYDAVATLNSAFRCKLPNFTYVIGEEGYIEVPDFLEGKIMFHYIN